MKLARILLYCAGYICQYIMPIVLFGIVVPYYHGTIAPGATGAGIVALCIILSITYRRLEEKIEKNLSGFWHGFILSIFPITIWIALGIGIYRVLEFFNTLANYWWTALIFIIIGRVCTIIADSINDIGGEDG